MTVCLTIIISIKINLSLPQSVISGEEALREYLRTKVVTVEY